ncbi:hypothetical protein D3C78_854730 [compost metagenome]
MNNNAQSLLYRLRSIVFLAVLVPIATSVCHADYLYVGDQADNTVKRFDAETGGFLGDFVRRGTGHIKGSRGIIFNSFGDMLVSNQNVGTEKSGELLKYDGMAGDFLGALVRHNDRDAPFAPGGIILKDGILFVADQASVGKNNPPGRLLAYAEDGALQADLTPNPSTEFPGASSTDEFHPRGIVLGPDGLLYVSVTHDLDPESDHQNLLPGWILRFDPATRRFVDVFASHTGAGCAAALHRPDGLVFGPDGRLYVAAFRADANDTDKVLIFDGAGACVDQIELYQVGQPRAFAQGLLFGPGAALFIPITGGGPDAGSVRRYDVSTKAYSVFVAPAALGGPLGSGWYLTFGRTAADTLSYLASPPPGGGPNLARCFCQDGTQVDVCATLDCFSGPEQDAICGSACSGNGGLSATACFTAEPVCAVPPSASSAVFKGINNR